jgi:hypothetical protein
VDGRVVSSDVVCGDLRSTAPQLSISQKALRTLSEDGNVMPKHVGATKHNNNNNNNIYLFTANGLSPGGSDYFTRIS